MMRTENRLYKIVFAYAFLRVNVDQISKLPPKQSKMIIMIMVNALRAIFALYERIAICALTEPERSKTHTLILRYG